MLEAHVTMRTKHQTVGRGAGPHLQPVNVAIVRDPPILAAQQVRRHRNDSRDASKGVATTRHLAGAA